MIPHPSRQDGPPPPWRSNTGWFICPKTWVGLTSIGGVPPAVGRYCSYLLPKQDGGTSQILVIPTKVLGQMNHPVDSTPPAEVRANTITTIGPQTPGYNVLKDLFQKWASFECNKFKRKNVFSQGGPEARSVWEKARVRTPDSQGNQMHSNNLWYL